MKIKKVGKVIATLKDRTGHPLRGRYSIDNTKL